MGDASGLLITFLQLVFWLVIMFAGFSWLVNRLFPKNSFARRIFVNVFRLILVAPFKKCYRAARWLVVKFLAADPEYRLRQVFLEEYPITPLQFYGVIEQAFDARQIIGAEVSRIARLEWHLFSTRRVYLLIRFRDAVCFISGVTLGTGFLISWRYTAMPRRSLLVMFQVPYLGVLFERLLKPPTFYRADIYHAFEEGVRSTVLQAANLLTNQGVRPLAENEARPLLREFYGGN